MSTISDLKRSGRPRRTVRAQVLREETHCWICGHPVNVDMGPRHPLSPEVDELIPVKHGGSTTDRTNLRLSHRICNQTRCAKPVTHQVRAKCRAKVELVMAGGTLPTKPRNRRTTTQRERPSNPRW
jgi:hypothetical protein